jgi:hypothetical protein
MIMKQQDRNIKISRLAARTAVKIFIIILLVGILPLVSGDQPWSARLESSHLVIPNKWTLIFPAILFIGFVALLILCIKKKYQVPDFNWLLVLNTLILLAYLVMLYSRIYQALTIV